MDLKFGDPIVFIENEKEINAIFLRSRILDDHLGSNGEPLVDLGFFQQVTAPGPDGKLVIRDLVGTDWATDIVQFRIDVPHVSHEFSQEAKKKLMRIYGGTEVTHPVGDPSPHCVYPGGRWKLQENPPDNPPAEELKVEEPAAAEEPAQESEADEPTKEAPHKSRRSK